MHATFSAYWRLLDPGLAALFAGVRDSAGARRDSVERSRVVDGLAADARRRGRRTRRDAVDTFEHVFREFDRLESLLSVWKDGSDVVRMNKNAGVAPVPVSQDTIDVLREARTRPAS